MQHSPALWGNLWQDEPANEIARLREAPRGQADTSVAPLARVPGPTSPLESNLGAQLIQNSCVALREARCDRSRFRRRGNPRRGLIAVPIWPISVCTAEYLKGRRRYFSGRFEPGFSGVFCKISHHLRNASARCPSSVFQRSASSRRPPLDFPSGVWPVWIKRNHLRE